jgi:hypothetical protein
LDSARRYRDSLLTEAVWTPVTEPLEVQIQGSAFR